ncbi:hypothetical protein T265_13249, partial [Opisthorchis viverrini]
MDYEIPTDRALSAVSETLDAIKKRPHQQQIVMGVGSGLVAGYIFAKIGRVAALILGGGLIALQKEIKYEVSVLKREKAPGPDVLYPALFNKGGKSLLTYLTKHIDAIWREEKASAEWGMPTVTLFIKKSTQPLHEKHRGISPITVKSKMLRPHPSKVE